jgi:uncharacterized protein YndB with AHSA1/START domain
MWFPLEPTELDYLKRAPHRFENEAVIRAPAERVFQLLSEGHSMGSWFQDFVACRWTSQAPHGVGSTREIELKALTVKERFLSWEPGRRLSFAIYAITVPLVRQMVEDLELEPLDDGRTRVRWHAHYTPSLAMRVAHPVGRAVFGKMFRTSLAGLTRVAEER